MDSTNNFICSVDIELVGKYKLTYENVIFDSGAYAPVLVLAEPKFRAIYNLMLGKERVLNKNKAKGFIRVNQGIGFEAIFSKVAIQDKKGHRIERTEVTIFVQSTDSSTLMPSGEEAYLIGHPKKRKYKMTERQKFKALSVSTREDSMSVRENRFWT